MSIVASFPARAPLGIAGRDTGRRPGDGRGKRLLVDTGLAISLLLAWMGCDGGVHGLGDPCERAAESCESSGCPCKVADPTEHCVRLDGCRDDRDCPAGTACISRGDDAAQLVTSLAACAAPEGEAREGRCTIASQGFARALIDGFLVNEFLLDPVADTSAFAISPPMDARFVACALFGCRPDVRAPRRDVEDNPIGEIVNFAQCSLSGAAAVFTLSEQSVESTEILAFTPSVSAEQEVCASACLGVPPEQTLPPRARQLTELGVGCWAYDDTQLIGATLVVPVPPDRIGAIPNIQSILSDCADGITSTGKSCLVGGEPELLSAPLLGTCFEGACQPRCVTAADCPAAVPSKACPKPTPTCARSPEDADWPGKPGFVGVCLYRACDRDDLADAGASADAGAGGGESP